MEYLLNIIRKGSYATFSLLTILLGFIACSSLGGDKPMEEPTITKVTPVNELYKVLDFTAIAAHRGYFRVSPEESLAAFQDGINLGIEFLEVDTQTTADGVAILFHDATVNRITNGSGTVSQMNYSAISQLKLKNKNGVLTNEPIATLEQGLRKIKGKNIYMHIEVKDLNFEEVIKIIRKTETQKQVLVFVSDRASYDMVASYQDIYFNAVCSNVTNFNFFSTQTNVSSLNLAGTIFSASYASQAKSKNKLTWRGVTDKPDDAELISGASSKPNLDATIQINPAIIHTDYADLLKIYLKSKGKR